METSAQVLEDNRVKVTVTIEADTVSARMKKQYKDFANRYNFPGFRKGKAPRQVIDNALGKEAAAGMVTDGLVNETCGQAMDQCGLYPVTKPDFSEDMPLVVDGAAYTYEFEVGVKPVFELDSYEPAAIELPAEGVSDSEVDDEIDTMREHYYDIVDAAANTKIKADNYADLAIKATDDQGADIASITTESRQYGIGSGLFPASFDDELIGLKKGDSKQFAIDVPAEPTVMTSSLMGKTAKINFDVTVNQVKKKKLPELTDEWVKSTLGLESVEDLRKNISDSISEQKNAILPRLKENRVLEALSARLVGETPESMVEEAEANLIQDFFQQLQSQGMTFDAYLAAQNLTSQQFRDDVKKQARDMAVQDLALDAWAAHFGFEATGKDVTDEFVRSGAPDARALEEEWRTSGRLYLVRQGILRQKAAADAVEKAVVTEQVPEKKDGKAPKHAKKDDAADKLAEDAAAE